MSHRFQIVLSWSHEDAVFIAEVAELPGCMAHGDSAERALGECREAIELWMDTARETGRAVPEPKGQRLNPA
jgi:predicted RNase H-like HicB family nuclease